MLESMGPRGLSVNEKLKNSLFYGAEPDFAATKIKEKFF
jgi:hypothetical protein